MFSAVFLLLAPTLARPSEPRREFPYETVAKEYLAAHGLSGATVDKVDYEKVLAEHYTSAQLGMFQMLFPVASLEKHAEEFKKGAAALVAAQVEWLDWLKPAGMDQKAIREDLAQLAGWIKTWKPQGLAKLQGSAGKDALDLLVASDAVKAAAKHAAEVMGKNAELGTPRELSQSVRLILQPTRKEFVEFVCFAGWLFETDRGLYWAEGAPDWTQCWVAGEQVVALEYTAPGRKPTEYIQGTGMNEGDPTVMEQQVVQLALNSLFERTYGERVPAAFAQGLSMNLVIDQFTEINTRVDGDTHSKTTSAREVFIPGGDKDGGMLGKNSAESKWREGHGKDHFLKVLKLAQKEGGEVDKKAKNKAVLFALHAPSGADPVAVSAPFLGKAAAGFKPPADKYLGEFAELLRDYKSAFIYWLQNKAAGSEKLSKEKFAQLLSKLADPNLQSDFEAVFSEVYDKAPLSAPEADKNSLEGKFLIWLTHS